MKYKLPFILGSLLITPSALLAAGLTLTSPAPANYFAREVSLSGSIGLFGAYGRVNTGSAYVFHNLNTATGSITENFNLEASDKAANDHFGFSVSLSETSGLIGAYGDDDKGIDSGSAYVFRNLDTATGPVTQNVKLTASDGAAADNFGYSVSLSGTIGLVGAFRDDDKGSESGSVYVFRNLNTATGSVTQNAKLTASDGAISDYFGQAVSLSGTIGLVGAHQDDDKGLESGSAYVFRNLNTANGSITQNVKLTASDGAAGDNFGYSVSLSGTMALIGAGHDADLGVYSGSAYVFRNLDTATGSMTQNVKLTASDGATYNQFGRYVSLSGSTGLIGAYGDDDKAPSSGSAYIFLNLDTAIGSVTENVKLIASDGAQSDLFGFSVSLDGDNFLIGAYAKRNASGKAYTGTVSSVTTLDMGNTSRIIDGLSFTSQDDWIIGQNTEANTVTLSSGDTGNVLALGKFIFIGKLSGAEDNKLIISGNLNTTDIYIGANGLNTGNLLQLNSGSLLEAQNIFLADENTLSIQGDYSDFTALDTYLGDTDLKVWADNLWISVNSGNYARYISSTYNSIVGYTSIQTAAVPEPSRMMLLLVGSGLIRGRRKRR